jgi:menaquinone-dependent protoporphyrinogen oxidase
MARVLVSYGSRNGATAELAAWIADELRHHRYDVRIHAADAVSDVSGFDAVVIGGSLYFGRWHRASRDFVRRHRTTLLDRPIWLFSSGPLEPLAETNEPGPVPYVGAVLRGLQARGHRTFGGRLYGDSGGLARAWLSSRRTAGDYRDETSVRDWASQIAVELATGTVTQSATSTADPLKDPAARSASA